MTRAFVKHSRKILEQNLLKSGETLLIVTPHEYDQDFISSFLEAAAEIGAVGGHLAVVPRIDEYGLAKGLTEWHLNLFASADLVITTKVGAGPGSNLADFGHWGGKVGHHPYRVDRESVLREGSKTRWLSMGIFVLDSYMRTLYFPTPERAKLSLSCVEVLDKAKEMRITSNAGSDLVMKKGGRPGACQYGFADSPGRWDNFGYGCIASAPHEDSADGTLVLEPGDMIPDLKPYPVLTETVRLQFSGGYVTKIEGGEAAKTLEKYLASYGDKEAYGISHAGWGTHEKARLPLGEYWTTLDSSYDANIGMFHHNAIGSILISLGDNFGLGLGGKNLKYSGLGPSTRISKSHTHFTCYNANFYCDDEKVIDNGKLLLKN
ncbi:MAG: M29 family metallopeptidase [Nitrososphaerales archaeon]